MDCGNFPMGKLVPSDAWWFSSVVVRLSFDTEVEDLWSYSWT